MRFVLAFLAFEWLHDDIYVTGPAKIDHVSAKKSPIFSVFAVS